MMKYKNFLLFTLIILFAITGFTALTACGDDNKNKPNSGSDNDAKISETAETKIEIGYTAPDFEFELLSGETAKLSDYRGMAVLLNFWATWCGPCTGEMPDIQRLSEAFAGELAVIAVNCSEKKEKIESFIAENGYTFNIGLDETGIIQAKYPTDGIGIPYTIVIDPNGIITEIHVGAGNDMFSVYEKDINAALGK